MLYSEYELCEDQLTDSYSLRKGVSSFPPYFRYFCR